MRIGIDARMYRSEVAGIGRYSQNLIRNLLELDRENEYVFFMTPKDKEEFDKLKIENLKFKIIIADIPHYSLAEQTRLSKIIASENLNLMHFLNFNYPVNYKGKFIATVHDLTLYFYPDTAKKSSFLKRAAFLYVLKSVCKQAQKIIAVSENTKKDLIKVFKTNKNKIEVIYSAADEKDFAAPSKEIIENLKRKYHFLNLPIILYVGQWRPHKNIVGLIEAFSILKKDIPARLVIIGKIDPKHKNILQTIDKLNLKDDIVMPGFVDDSELAAWYNLATVFCFPSFYEGFGLPGLEAMQAGTAVAAANTSSLPEIYKNAAIYFDPCNPYDIADKIKTVIADSKLRADLIRKGKTIANNYSWRKTAEETLKIYKKIK